MAVELVSRDALDELTALVLGLSALLVRLVARLARKILGS